MVLELYHAGLSTNSLKVRLTFREKELDYVSHFVSIRDNEHLTDEYLAINPHGVVPTLVHDGHVIMESTTINEYMEDVFPEPRLRPLDPVKRAKMRNVGKLIDEYIRPGTGIFNWKNRRSKTVRSYSDELYEWALARVDEPFKRRLYIGARAGGYSDEILAGQKELAEWGLREMEWYLEEGPWLAGAEYSLADINSLASITRAHEHMPEQFGPRLREWYDRMYARPSVKEVYFPSEDAPARVHYGEKPAV